MTIGIRGAVGSVGTGTGTRPEASSGFTPAYSGGAPMTAEMAIESSRGNQRVAIPAGATTIRVTWFGYGPFRYRLGSVSAVALSTDAPAIPGYQIILPVGTNTHLAVYGFGAGSVVIEGGSGGI